MRRLRILFAIFTLVLLAPIGLLVQRSLRSFALEKRMQEQVLAERIFDEMERGLSRILEAEEQRPVDQYGVGADPETERFVVGRFEVDATNLGSAASPRRQAELAAAIGDKKSKDDDETPLDAEVAGYFREPAAAAGKNELSTRQAPGTTMRLNDSAELAGRDQRRDEAKKKSVLSEYDALRSLNKAAEERVMGRVKQIEGENAVKERMRELVREVEGVDASAVASGTREAPSVVESEILDLGAGAFATANMSGRTVAPDRMLLYRTVARDSAVYYQGILVDIAALGDWLRAGSIGETGLSDFARVELVTSAAAPSNAEGGTTTYSHRFAPPFADLSAFLRLRALASRSSGLYAQALSATLIAATLLGLAFLYRTVAVTVRFAERRSNFVAAVSHELKTPLTAIRMYGEMLRDGVVASEAKRDEYYRHITNESERLSRLINNVLEYSKLEKGTRPVHLTSASVVPVMTEVAEMMRPHASEHGFELQLELEANLPAVRLEADALMQVLWNLVDNAVKYARGGLDRRIALQATRDGERVVIAVRDHGPGVDKRQLDEIFEPFYRGENELTRTAKGTGLGLALVQGLVKRMGATVTSRNAADGGFVVEIRFPVAQV